MLTLVGNYILSESVFACPVGNLDNFQIGMGRLQALRLSHGYAVGGLLPISTPYGAGVEFGCIFIPTFVQNVQQKIRNRLHTFAVYYY